MWRQVYECKRGEKGCFADEKTELMILKELREKVRQDCDGEGDAGKRGEAASRTWREGRGGESELAISNILGHKISIVTEACQEKSEDQILEIRN